MPTVTQSSTHTASVAASAGFLYDLVADVEQMRRIFTPVVHTAFLERGGTADRVERWTWEAHLDAVRTWRASRTLDRDAGRIAFRHENPAAPLLEVTGEWSFKPLSDGLTEVELRHEFTLDPDAEGADRTAAMFDRGAGMQLGRVKNFAEEYDELRAREVSYEVSYTIDQPIEDVYGYFYEVDKWRERIPHCLNAERREDVPNLQVVVMDVQVPSGALHTTKQARVCFPNEKIMWRQLEGLPPLDEMLYGYMTFTRTPAGVEVRTGQTELLKPTGVAKRGWSMDEAKQHVAEVRGGRNLDAIKSAEEFLRRRG
ncbi:aromatase/cyclase [Saccharothrix australiensis]|uniref:Aromatase/bifunctional aromatase (Cyclase/dehydratase)/C7-C12 aromatase (ARO/CYC) n=1 Tax=Saccharothrix australiensis TaxID=2072 RepID=A0A495W4E5_9PSEU|nr:SRPBCC family protein [Saccharothrix australiensis]RKT55533.1 aromatase/bifunctional aromatase (cyclase/dehydratase)/C7-C12 aromatase (ARO/CYC) [Saccharothrix australiensis]